MKKIKILLFTALLFSLTFAVFAAEKENNVVNVISGKDNHKSLINSKEVYIYFTFNNTLLWKDTQTVDEFLKSRKNRGDKAKEDKEVMIKDFYKKVDTMIKLLGKKWNLKRVADPKEVKSGYIIFFNYDKCFPVPGMGAEGYASISVYTSDNQTKSLIEGTVKSFSIAKTFAHYDPKFQFSELGQRFMKEITSFLDGKSTVYK